ncbi:MAG TPA: acetoin utilization protein AcuC [Longimicrobiales bacterium]
MPTKCAFVWDDQLSSYRFSEHHPLNPERLGLTLMRMRRLDLLDGRNVHIIKPRVATDEELISVHAREYVAAIKRGQPDLRYGLGTEDVPAVPGMHEAAAHIVGATLVAAEQVMSGAVTRAFSMSGGLHHAHRMQASGFCIYNDLAVAIRYMQQTWGARVMYIDYDAHHGDGVQWIFYHDPEVLTVSYHESGAFLFPGTGFIDEIGEGEGYGYSVNVPLDPNTEDESFIQVFRDLVPMLADAFQPNVIVLQNGCDAHFLDPLTHLRTTTRMTEAVVRTVIEIADKHCEGRIVATGGGGYAIEEVVPRAWSMVWSLLRGIDPDPSLYDPPGLVPPLPNNHAEMNDKTMRAARARVMPLVTGWGLAF